MTPNKPYQPFLLRLLHGLTGLFLLAAMLTAYWTYNTYDGRWGRIPLPAYPEIEGIHGTFGLGTLLVFPAFVIYAFHRGQRRLVPGDAWHLLTQVGRPLWWYTLSRVTNTLALVALTFALFTGKMMDETWLPKGELQHGWYYAHLLAWVVMGVTVLCHLLLNAKVGGAPLLLSMLSWQFRDHDSPRLWPTHVSRWWSQVRQGAWRRWCQPITAMRVLELAIWVTLAAAWIVPLVKH
ncbi:cytochrome b/b6 domain-containing protein [Gloeomargarita sp.]